MSRQVYSRRAHNVAISEVDDMLVVHIALQADRKAGKYANIC